MGPSSESRGLYKFPRNSHLVFHSLSSTEPDGRVGRAGAPGSKGHGFNPCLDPILNDFKIFMIFVQIFKTNDNEPLHRYMVVLFRQPVLWDMVVLFRQPVL